MRIMVTGAGGMTGAEVSKQVLARGWECASFGRSELDICDDAAVLAAVTESRADIVINAAAYTAVDEAEHNEDVAMQVNAIGAGNVARAASAAGAGVIHISTDYVFDGNSRIPYLPSDVTSPLSAYGRSKLAGEIAVRTAAGRHLIVRTSWVYSHEGRNFVQTMLRLAATKKQIAVVNDQYGSPTSAQDLAGALIRAAISMERNRAFNGTHHFTNSGVTTWYDFARSIFDIRGGASPAVNPIPTSEYPTPARRPPWSVLDCSSFESGAEVARRPWQAALADVLVRLQ